MDLIEKFKREKLKEVREREKQANKWRENFISKYPRNSIISMQMNDYLISRNGFGSQDSFCRRIDLELKTTYHIYSSNTWAEIYGIALKNGTQLTLSKKFEFDGDYDKAFISIKNEIIDLLEAVDKNDYMVVELCKLHSYFKYMLLIIYFPEKVIQVCSESLLSRYCERVGIIFNSDKDMIYANRALIEWKNSVPEMAEWNNFILTFFCDWLYRKNLTFNMEIHRRNTDISVDEFIEEIENLNLEGKSKEAFIKVRINQGIFREKLLKKYRKCCLCDISNQKLLVASHIKPWSESEANEKLDSDNGFLMCPNHDKLFDQGWITFDDDGKIIVADGLSEEDRNSLGIKTDMKIMLTEKNKKYLQYHRKKIFKKCIEK